MEGALSGASANFRDEIYGASKASGLPDVLGGFRAPVGAARLAYEHLTGQPGEASKAYDEAVAHIRDIQNRAQTQYPNTYGAGNLVGTVAGMAMLPGAGEVTAAGLLPRIGQAIKGGATVGAEYGALAGAGEGEDLTNRAVGAGLGAVSGGIGGGAGGAGGELARGRRKTWIRLFWQTVGSNLSRLEKSGRGSRAARCRRHHGRSAKHRNWAINGVDTFRMAFSQASR